MKNTRLFSICLLGVIMLLGGSSNSANGSSTEYSRDDKVGNVDSGLPQNIKSDPLPIESTVPPTGAEPDHAKGTAGDTTSQSTSLTQKIILYGLLVAVIAILIHSYAMNWYKDARGSLLGLISPFVLGLLASYFGWQIGVFVFCFSHIISHYAGRCGQCGAASANVKKVSKVAVGERTITVKRAQTKRHYDNNGKETGTTDESVYSPETHTIYETSWECKRCSHAWTTRNDPKNRTDRSATGGQVKRMWDKIWSV